MERLFTYWTKHCPALGADSRSLVRDRSKVRRYAKQQVIKLETERFPFFCIVLSGLVAGYRRNSRGTPLLCELMQPMDYFTGTEHPFTPRLRQAEYTALEKTELLLLPVAEAREAQLRLPAFAELVQVMKQRKINFLELLIALDSEDTCYARYCVYMAQYGSQAIRLPDAPQWQLLRMSRTSYYRAKARYLRDRNRN
ncbi:cAMP-binding domain of CRP or a regulatory subunit of cAMP-dependent protein kinases [Parapedobacter luteus]|uniref:cAMP-binding domain of CRP or a regulatory subunit of cAMP-dependent protein kinases n=1 Tax=Parapedobacter luteus TaxID=623280 RepID=A0A1T5CJA7_9SPHI|nr:cAMP-binding domain of CRP or a regulatory subunit of cAMP-dependent protein kinases [Parapedobacter luteus]